MIFGLKQYLTSFGVNRAYLKADSALRYEVSGRVDLKKVTVIFYSTQGVQTSVLTARTGVYWIRTNQMFAGGGALGEVQERSQDRNLLKNSRLP